MSQSSTTIQSSGCDASINLSASGVPNTHRHSSNGFSTKIRQIIRQMPTNKILKLNREMSNIEEISHISNETTETSLCRTSNGIRNSTCSAAGSPQYIVRIAATGNVQEFEKLISNDLSKLKVFNPSGLCAAHTAAARNRIAILALIAQFNGDLNIEDTNGWTPLHHAVRNNALNAIEFLLDNGVDDARLNKQYEAPIHLAVIHNQLKALKLIISKRPGQVNLPGERKQTPLHYTALIDNVEAAKILTDNHASLYIQSDVGSYPVHVAALNSSNRVFNHLFETVKSRNNGTKDLLNICDAEKHRPLHSSVLGGNIEAVDICLKNGGSVDDQQDDLSTPVHLASSQGSIELLQLMFACQPHLKSKVIHMADVQGMTPLHKAAMGDHTDVLEFLLEHGSDIDARDISKRTPLLLAALNSSVQSVCFLLSNNASLLCRDEFDRNLLHFVIMQNLPIGTIGDILFKRDNYRLLFDQRDHDGNYPIHYASRDGQVNVLITLIKHGAEINKKTNQRQSSLHFAAEYGRYNTCRQLLDTPGFKRILNEPDQAGQTPLHLCCQHGHTRVVELLLHKGAQLTKCYEGNTPLHASAANGHVATIHIILQAHAHLINSVNSHGMTPLHCAALAGHVQCVDLLLSKAAQLLTNLDGETFFDLAIMKKQKDVCLIVIAHERWKEALDLPSVKYRRPLLGLIEHLPDCVPVLFDRCITHSHDDKKHKDFHLIYDFHYINWMDVQQINGKEYCYPMLPLNVRIFARIFSFK